MAGGACWLVDLSSDLRLDEVLNRTIENALAALPGREFAVLLMVDDELRLVRHSGLRPIVRRRIERWTAGDALLLGEPGEDGPMRAEPLLFGDRSLGVIVTLTADGVPLTDRDRETFADFAEQAAIALRNAHLFQQLLERATRDALTGLANRRELERMLARELERSSRYAEIFSVVMIDLDGFKELNDRLGHAAGDKILRQAATTIEAACRAADVGARLGGDEFVLILPQTNQFEAAALCERLRAQVEKLGDLSLSWGVAEYPTHGVDADQLMRAADAAMYASKPRVAGGERAGG